MTCPRLPAGFDPTDPDIYAERIPVEELAELRHNAPIWWCDQPIGKGGFNDGGFWVVTKHKDVKEVSLRNDVFSSWLNGAIPRFADDMKREDIDLQRFVLLNMDPPQHTLPGVHAARDRPAARRAQRTCARHCEGRRLPGVR